VERGSHWSLPLDREQRGTEIGDDCGRRWRAVVAAVVAAGRALVVGRALDAMGRCGRDVLCNGQRVARGQRTAWYRSAEVTNRSAASSSFFFFSSSLVLASTADGGALWRREGEEELSSLCLVPALSVVRPDAPFLVRPG